MSKEKGYVIYEGPSMINGEPIVAVVTMKSNNVKTGNMASMWIMSADEKPTDATKSGADQAVCGMCPHRHHLGGSCYVVLFQAPLNVYKTYKRGGYALATDLNVFDNVLIRFGAYGDPAALPLDLLNGIKARAKNHTSYTHQWKSNDNDILKTTSMASVDSKAEAMQAQENGWRTFRVTKDISDLLSTEIVCPNTTHGIECKDCKLCSGYSKAKNIVIEVHGTKKNKFEELV